MAHGHDAILAAEDQLHRAAIGGERRAGAENLGAVGKQRGGDPRLRSRRRRGRAAGASVVSASASPSTAGSTASSLSHGRSAAGGARGEEAGDERAVDVGAEAGRRDQRQRPHAFRPQRRQRRRGRRAERMGDEMGAAHPLGGERRGHGCREALDLDRLVKRRAAVAGQIQRQARRGPAADGRSSAARR